MSKTKARAHAFILGFLITYVAINLLGFPLLVKDQIGWFWSTIMLLLNSIILISTVRKL